MKNQLLFLIFSACACYTNAQITDLQWLIVNGKGKQGTSGDFNSYPDLNVIGNVFTLTNVSMPNSANNPEAFNDLFVIYGDWNHYNSRYSLVSDPFFRTTGGFSTTTDHSFSSSSASPISYMYLTNGYEQDDLPRKLMVNNSSGSPTPYIFGTTITPALSASHDAVLTKDITLVINMDSVRHHLHGSSTYRLFFDGVEPISSPSVPITGLDIYDPSPVFNGSAEYPAGTMAISGEVAELHDVPGTYKYLNLRANDNALIYPPNSFGEPQYNALFRIESETKSIVLKEPIRFSHDPNFLRVDSICRDETAGYYIYYHLEFENENDVATTSLYATVDLPEEFDPGCIVPIKWMTAGVECEGELEVDGNSCTFTFPATDCAGIIQSKADPNLAKGFVEFRVKVDPGYDVRVVTNPIRLNIPVVYMDEVPTKITDFRDLINAKANPYRPTLHHTCKFCGGGIPPWAWVVVSGFILGGGALLLRGRLV